MHPESEGLIARLVEELNAGSVRNRYVASLPAAIQPMMACYTVLFSGYVDVAKNVVKDLKAMASPAGNFHVSLMFGPLVIESGIEE